MASGVFFTLSQRNAAAPLPAPPWRLPFLLDERLSTVPFRPSFLNLHDPPPLSSRPSGRDLKPAMERSPAKKQRDFSLRFEMTAGAASRPSPYRER